MLEDLDKLTGWGDNVKTMQANWIGKSKGAIFKFPVVDAPNGETIEVPVYTQDLIQYLVLHTLL